MLSVAHETGFLAFNVGAAVRLPAVRNRLAERILPETDVLRLIHRVRKHGGQLALFSKGGKSRTVLLGAAAWEVLLQLRPDPDGPEAPAEDRHVFRGQRGPLTRKGTRRPHTHWIAARTCTWSSKLSGTQA